MLLAASVAAYSSESAMNESANSSISSLASSNSADNGKISNLIAENNYLLSELNASHTAYSDLLSNYSRKSYVFVPSGANQTFQIWGERQTLSAGGSIQWDLLDTFQNHINISTSQPARFYIFSLYGFITYTNGYGKNSDPLVNITGSSFVYNFEPSVGCAVYVLDIENLGTTPATITPHVTATYAPTGFPTGICSG